MSLALYFLDCYDDGMQKTRSTSAASHPVHGKTRHACGLCGSTRKKLIKTDCCDNWICDDEEDYVLFSYARNSCSRNHRRFTLCGHHACEEHSGEWQTCKKCLSDFSHEMEMYVWYGTNQYNFTTLENTPPFQPTHCGKCGTHIILPEGGYSVLCGEYRCVDCPIDDKERDEIIRSYEKSKAHQ